MYMLEVYILEVFTVLTSVLFCSVVFCSVLFCSLVSGFAVHIHTCEQVCTGALFISIKQVRDKVGML